MRVALAVVVPLMVAGLFGVVPSASADKIAFSRIANQTERHWVMRSDGSGKRRLPQFGVSSWWDVSMDGRRLVWAYPNDYSIVTGTLYGKRIRVVWRQEFPPPLFPRWSPSGRRIAAVRPVKPENLGQIFIIDPKRRRARRLHVPDVNIRGTPTWSPDGRRIAATGFRRQTTCTPLPPPFPPACQSTETQGMWIIDVASAATREIPGVVPQGGVVGAPVWSPDGRTIAFPRQDAPPDQGIPQLWLVRPDGSGLSQLTHLPGGAAGPSWSPSGRRLAFETDVGSQNLRNIGTIRADGSRMRVLTRGGLNLDPDWSR